MVVQPAPRARNAVGRSVAAGDALERDRTRIDGAVGVDADVCASGMAARAAQPARILEGKLRLFEPVASIIAPAGCVQIRLRRKKQSPVGTRQAGKSHAE